ncbi:DNA polymerase-3 subunit gamma/tau [Lihuaxuella thermophila]|uniref:DNA-directed DNA polymerase n=1 Tax=Lihuaxuella thermophila TaxID=1173111 RepID=A0A1H8BSM4_9BACL|nr:DNA polymerase-3 subunit gamma/tau [Lihuaxuella thermophila]
MLGVSYRALYRVWRPQRFAELVGQEHVTQTLMNALREGHLSHAYLFNGPRGTGKTSAAKILAKAVNCERGPSPEPCNECEACRRITEGTLMDVVEIDAASNRGVDEIRDLRDKVKYAPTEVRYKVYIIDEVHMLTTEAFNALLKTLEEPPAHVVFILATTEPHKLPPTIISRCQRFSFRRISFEHIIGRLRVILESGQIDYEERALFAIARAADGGMRDALSLLDQALAFGGDRLDESVVLAITGSASQDAVYRILQGVARLDAASALNELDECVMNGLEPEKLIQDLTHACRDLLLFKTAPQLTEKNGRWTGEGDAVRLAESLPVSRLTEMLDVLVHHQQQMKWTPHPRILLEMAIVRLAHSQEDVGGFEPDAVRELKERVRRLEQEIEKLKQSPVAVSSPPPSAPPGAGFSSKEEERRPSSAKSLAVRKEWLGQLSSEGLAEVRRAWPEILGRVKEEKITVHAWLIDGEPVGAAQDKVIVAFKSKIHRETTEKEANKALIQQVMTQVLGRPVTLHTIMLPEWNELRAAAPAQPSPGETQPVQQVREDDVVKKAIDFFGENLVEISDQL